MEDRASKTQSQKSLSKKLLDFSKKHKPDIKKSSWQIVNTLIPYFGLWGLMIYLVQRESPYWVVLIASVLAAGLLVRLFIIFHDCCHRSYFVSPVANVILGNLLGFLIFISYDEWRYLHLKHHGTTGNLDKRGLGDIWTMTVDEYLNASLWQRFKYRGFRNPLVMFIIGPLFYFIISQRFWHNKATIKQKISVLLTNLALLLTIGIFHFTIGLKTFAAIQLPVIFFAGAAGIWLFYVQHQYEGVYWARQKDWNQTQASLEGSSFFKLPKILQWISGNIGFHHIHHLRPQIPNYYLQQCFHKIPELQTVKIIKISDSISTFFLKLWNEQQSKLISFRDFKKLEHQLHSKS